eukprot:TRINITY_DN30646_c0_g1_i1.p1 TRINITY_DN30646_c0_g1~~TRINITY_DN30646_c0_g1_i1.p1  ORF type:complete len:131 (+),score=17.86 TRINITY_DN30646_c0_g1_i1:85-477(+)
MAGFFQQLIADWKAADKAAKIKTDAKVPLSAERTLLRWLRSAVILSSLSAFLSSLPEKASQVNGLLLGIVALLFVIIPGVKYVRRSLDLTKAQAVQPKVDRALVDVLSFATATVLTAVLMVDIVYGSVSM